MKAFAHERAAALMPLALSEGIAAAVKRRPKLTHFGRECVV
jgi:hypothetical protein